MKKKLIISLICVLFLTGCTNFTLKKAYRNMQIRGFGIEGYCVSIQLNGITRDAIINENVSVNNYKNKQFLIRTNGTTKYYILEKEKYYEVKLDNGIIFKSKSKKAINYIPYIDTNLYLTSIKKARNIKKLENIVETNVKYNVFEYKITSNEMKKILKGTSLENIKFNKDVPVYIMIDKNRKVYKIEYKLNEALGQKDILSLSVYYININKVNKIIMDK